MTELLQTTEPASVSDLDWPSPDTQVLLRRRLAPGANTASLSVFADDEWYVIQGMFEAHVPSVKMNFLLIPAAFREAVKHFIWQVINYDCPVTLSGGVRRLSLHSVLNGFSLLVQFTVWLEIRGIRSFDDVTGELLDQYAEHVAAREISVKSKSSLLHEVRRLWSYRDRMPESMRLPQAPPWGGARPVEVLGGARHSGENSTPRVHPDTMELLLLWSLRFVQDFSEDIITAFDEHKRLWWSGGTTRMRFDQGRPGHKRGELRPLLLAYLQRLKESGGTLPGKRLPNGHYEPHWAHLSRILDCAPGAFALNRPGRRIVLESGIPIAPGVLLDNCPITGTMDGRPWRNGPIGYDEALQLADLLRTACFAVISYLSGMRPGEALNLERGCVKRDPATGLWQITGRKWKGARDERGDKAPEGEIRDDPWTTVDVVAHAVAVLERLHNHPLLFPTHLCAHRTRGGVSKSRAAEGRTASHIPHDIANLMDWVNDYCSTMGLADQQIPPDPTGMIAPARLRRTLAWHIVRRPRGLIAGAIQYGHLHVQLTLGYSGTYASGFPDEHAYETWLYQLERLAEDHERLQAGEHVSGPAADVYRHRVRTAHTHFAGRLLPRPRQAMDMLSNPLLQVYPGQAMTCVFDPDKALCQLTRGEGDTRRTPDQDDCRPTCRNISRTDRDIAQLHDRTVELHEIVNDPLAPPIRHQRETAELQRLTKIIQDHEESR